MCTSFNNWLEREKQKGRVEASREEIIHVKYWFNSRMNRDVSRLKNYDFPRANQKAKEWSDQLQQRSIELLNQKEKLEEREIIYEDEDYILLIPKTPEAAAKYGAGTRWCTVNKEMAINYMDDGHLYILISKKEKVWIGKIKQHVPVKYQFHIQTEQYTNSKDRSLTNEKKQELSKYIEIAEKKEKSYIDFIKAVNKNNVEYIKQALASGIDPSLFDNKAIKYATVYGRIEIIKLLLQDKIVDPSAGDNYTIRWAAERGHVEIVKLLLQDKRVDPSARDNDAIKSTARHRYTEIVKLLKEHPRVKAIMNETGKYY